MFLAVSALCSLAVEAVGAQRLRVQEPLPAIFCVRVYACVKVSLRDVLVPQTYKRINALLSAQALQTVLLPKALCAFGLQSARLKSMHDVELFVRQHRP